jgi:hypothetical protein
MVTMCTVSCNMRNIRFLSTEYMNIFWYYMYLNEQH